MRWNALPLLWVGAVAVGLLAVTLQTDLWPVLRRTFGAIHQYVFDSPPAKPAGPLPVATADVILAEEGAHGRYRAPILAGVHAPATPAAATVSGQPQPCGDWLARVTPAASLGRMPVILFAPGNNGTRHDDDSSLANLASHGFFVLSIDDLVQDSGRWSNGDEEAAHLDFDLSSSRSYAWTLRRAADKAVLQAEKALVALDRLTVCLQDQPGWADAVDPSNVGFLGFSFGGATASEAGVMDRRVRAVFNLDGWIFGQALTAKLDKPYWLALDDRSEPTAAQVASTSEADRNYVDLTGRLIDAALALSERDGGCAVKMTGARHESYIDAFFERRFASSWLHINPHRAKAIRDDLEVSFFNRLKVDGAAAGCGAILARWPELVRLKPISLGNETGLDRRELTRLRP